MGMRVILFNHKGGVSKTTTTFHLGWKLAELGKKVLLIDADSQCNLSGYVLGEEFDNYYENTLELKKGNIKDCLAPVFEALPQSIEPADCFVHSQNPNLILLPGHANLSEYDAQLSLAQMGNNAIPALQNLPGSFNFLLEKTEKKYGIDITLIDVNPSLSATNQNLFLCSDYFIIPTNPDPFSIMAIKALAKFLPNWDKWLEKSNIYFDNASYPLPNKKTKFIGWIAQRFNVRSGRATKSYSDQINKIEDCIANILVPSLEERKMVLPKKMYSQLNNNSRRYQFAEIQDFHSVLQRANIAFKPVFTLEDTELGVQGLPAEKMKLMISNFNQLFNDLATKVMSIDALKSNE